MTKPPPHALTRPAVLSGEIALSDVTRYRYGARKASDAAATRAHVTQSREWRRDLATAAFDLDDQARLLTLLPEHPDVAEAAGLIGVTAGQVYGRMRWDSEFAEQVETLLATHCRALRNGGCGTARGFKRGGRCQACRQAHRAPATGVRRFNRPRTKSTPLPPVAP